MTDKGNMEPNLKNNPPEKDTKIMSNDEFTNSSILEFLNQEQQCLDLNATVLDVDSIFEEINRLSDTNDDRSVDVILKEVECLLNNQTFDNLNKSVNNKNNTKCNKKASKCLEHFNTEEFISTEDLKFSRKLSPPKRVKNAQPDTNSQESVKFKNYSLENNPIEPVVQQEVEIKLKLNVNHPPLLDDTQNKGDLLEINDATTIENQVRSKKLLSTDLNLAKSKIVCDKSTSLSPSRFPSSNNDLNSWIQERMLKQEIEQLEEKLKDTEERFQSLRIQHDSLTQIHRILKENHAQSKDETERLKLEIQHMSECANILRGELQNARSDRNEAFEVQKLLKNELSDSRTDKKKLVEKNEKDSKLIQDLQRQCREMERILLRKHPDSVSALIVASRNSSNTHDDNLSGRHLLEQRITQLETDAKEQDAKAQVMLANVQSKFSSVQSKYETHIADLETQVLSLQEINSKLNEKLTVRIEEIEKYKQKPNLRSIHTQTNDKLDTEHSGVCSVGCQIDIKPLASTKPNINTPLGKKTIKLKNCYSETTVTQNNSAKEDAHLLATIRGMRVDLAIKEKAIQRLTREIDDCKKTIKKMQKERDNYFKIDKSAPTSSGGGSSSSNFKKIYDPNQFSENGNDRLKEGQNKMKVLEIDYKALHDKRLQDLQTIHATQERGLASCHETIKLLQQRLLEREEQVTNQKRRRLPIDYYALKSKMNTFCFN